MTSCRFSECNPDEVGGCPCRVVEMNGGPLSAMQVGELLGMPAERVRNMQTMTAVKLKKMKPTERERYRELLAQFEAPAESHADVVERSGSAISVRDAREMLDQMTKRWRELGWK